MGTPAQDHVPRVREMARHLLSPARRCDGIALARNQQHRHLGARDLEMVTTFAEFLKARRAARSFAHHAEMTHESSPASEPPSGERSESDTREPNGSPPAMAESGQRM